MTGVALASATNAPKYDWTPAEEIKISDGFISSLANRMGIDMNDAKVVLGEVSVKYGADYDSLYRTIQCESGFRNDGVFGDSGKAYGIAQFHLPTFKQFCTGDYTNMRDQLDCMAKMFSQNLQSHWTCFNHV